MKRTLALVVALWAPLAVAQEPTVPADAARQPQPQPEAHAQPGRFAAHDAAWLHRDEPGALDRLRAELESAEKETPGDYETLWRSARLYSWLSDDPAISDDEKSRLGKIGWEIAEKAVAADGSRVEGWHYAAVNMGNYSLGIGILKALSKGIEGKFKDRLSHAEKIAPTFSDGAIPTAWGRFWFKLPWPKYDGKKSEQALQEALRQNPDNVRARVYLADLYLKEDEDEKARAELERAAAAEPGRYDAPEERRYQALARQRLARPERR
jgi:tetratricopeptide (TPR) repeat protein